MGTASYSEEENIFPNRPHWLANAIDFVPARNVPPICWCPKDTPAEQNLCPTCRDVRLRHLIFCEAEGRTADLGKLDDLMNRSECDLCSLITFGSKEIVAARARHHVLPSQMNCQIAALYVAQQQAGGYALQIMVSWETVEFEMVYKGKLLKPTPAGRVFERHPKVDTGFLKTMLQVCDTSHSKCDKEISQGTPDQMCIIDLMGMSIGPAPENCRYCALSYVWGRITESWLTLRSENVADLGKKDSLLNARLPRTILDAMQLCRDLGERFLWVDSLCIVQNDPVFQKQQIDIMDEIYASASFTIIAAAGNHADAGLPGVSTWAREPARQIITIEDMEVSNVLPRLSSATERSVWNTRGWTYQERMFSKRAVFLTETQAYFACSTLVEAEIKDRLLPDTYWVGRFQNLVADLPLIKAFKDSVTEYTLRSLTNEGDILRAFLGVANYLSRKSGQPFYYGLPASDFASALLWQPAGESVVRIIHGLILPSWSWASAKGGVTYTFTEHIVTRDTNYRMPAIWMDGIEPNFFEIDWLLNINGTELTHINKSSRVTTNKVIPATPEIAVQLTLQEAGRLLFCTQHTYLLLKNSVPFVTADSWWTDYTTDLSRTTTSMISIHSATNIDEAIGFMELDKKWAITHLSPTDNSRKWDFIALSLAASNMDDYMNRHFTMRRNVNQPLVWSRNVRELLVNVMLIEWNHGVASRLGIGKIYLDFWEREQPEAKWIVLK